VVAFFAINAISREVSIDPSFVKLEAEAVATARAGLAVLVKKPLLGDVVFG
jgi:hypothetical protein